jgi:hypothetical protein
MNHLLNGVAIAAALVIAGPAWAQNPATPGHNAAGVQMPPPQEYNPATPSATGTGPAESSAMPPMHHAMHHARAMHHFHKRMAEKAHLAGDTTAALNRQELARIQAGAPPSAPTAPMGEGPPGSPQPAPSH